MDVVGCTLVPEDVQVEAVLHVKKKERPNKKLKTGSSSLTGGVQHEDVEDGLHAMVASPDWRALKQCNVVRGRQVTNMIQDGEGSTAGYLFEAMERAREEIKHRCDNDPTSTQITEYNTKSYDILTSIANHQMETIHLSIDLEYLGELLEYKERGNGDDEPAIPNEVIVNANDATSNATHDDIIFEELFGSSM
ncbi:hypothetical protein IFM89_000045 [Coptis chinensis]|uniref:Uncharacterized protein n=1 Tax=Coptis chinensis TaxID=261450 RepID=A0A835ITP1_9MAGN|nr:hypothetical protein IFM89_000045 [Coptis chinensis]